MLCSIYIWDHSNVYTYPLCLWLIYFTICNQIHIFAISIHFSYSTISIFQIDKGPSWPWSYGSWIYNYLCNQCLSPLILWIWISIRVRCTTVCDKVCQWLATGQWFSQGPPFSSTHKTVCHNITETLLKVALNAIKQTIELIRRHKYTWSWYNYILP